LECTLDVVRHFIPAAFRLGPGRKIVTDFVEVDCFEILARPVSGERLFQKRLEPSEPEFAHPIRILFDVRNVANGSFAQAGASIAHVRFRIKEVSFASINIDCRSLGFHCVFPPVYLNAGSTAPSRAQSYPLSSSSRASSFRPLLTIRPATITWTWSGTM